MIICYCRAFVRSARGIFNDSKQIELDSCIQSLIFLKNKKTNSKVFFILKTEQPSFTRNNCLIYFNVVGGFFSWNTISMIHFWQFKMERIEEMFFCSISVWQIKRKKVDMKQNRSLKRHIRFLKRCRRRRKLTIPGLTSVTNKKSPNIYKSCPKMISL